MPENRNHWKKQAIEAAKSIALAAAIKKVDDYFYQKPGKTADTKNKPKDTKKIKKFESNMPIQKRKMYQGTPQPEGKWQDEYTARPGGRSNGGAKGKAKSRTKNGPNDPYKLYSTVFRQTKIPGGRYTLNGIFDATNTATLGIAGGVFYLGYGTGTGVALFSKLSADAVSLLAIFSNIIVHKVTVKFVGTGASTTTGYMALGMDANTDSNLTTPSNLTSMTGSAGSDFVNVADVKGDIVINFSPPKGEIASCKSNDASAPASDQFAGKFKYFSSNNLAANAYLGLFQITVDLTMNL